MIKLDSIPIKLAHTGNYNQNKRNISQIKYIVMHYTSNIGDTAKNNVDYFSTAFTQSSAHFFISDGDIWQSVPITHAAYAVGLGSMKGPYSGTNPSHYKICTNSNSVSIEMCGSKTSREATSKTKQTACELAVSLMQFLGLTPSCIIRHYDVTGKSCPAWAVEYPAKWLEIMVEINKLFYGGNDDMIDNEENYQLFKKWMERLMAEKASETSAWSAPYMNWAGQQMLINDGKPALSVTRGELATVLYRFNEKLQNGGLPL